MSEITGDHYGVYYADKLWNLLPAIYRTLDTDQFAAAGPLREFVNRIGCTAAELRRSMDRMWEDQSIETCDDWVIPYIGALLDTRLVLGLEARGQRLDVAKTIDYRRRKGTLGVLEEIASDITGWDAKAVEFFRRLGRTRHGLDPAIGRTAGPDTAAGQLQRAEGLVGRLTDTRIGGFADLRNVNGALLSRTAFDEFFHTADSRAGSGLFGWQNIPHLGIFVWRLVSLPMGPATPVPVNGCPGWYCVDPTGRDIPVFAPSRTAANFGDGWVSPSQGQLPEPISQALLDADLKAGAAGLALYPKALCIFRQVSVLPPDIEPIAADTPGLKLRPARGRFALLSSPPPGPLLASYHYGFPSTIGAGPYDRRGQMITVPTPAPSLPLGGGGNLLSAMPGGGTVTLADSLTYDGAPDLNVPGSLTLNAGPKQRPLIRLDPATPWTITGGSADAVLAMDGLFISGQDIILAGQFASVTLTCCTLDPGSAAPAGEAALFLQSADGRALAPTRLWITGAIARLTIDRCVLGPIRTTTPGEIETISISNSTLQAIPTASGGVIAASEVKDPARLLRLLQLGLDPVSKYLQGLDPAMEILLGPPASPPLSEASPPSSDAPLLLNLLNNLLAGPSIFDAAAFRSVALSSKTQALLNASQTAQPAPALNRALLEDAYPLELADAALAFGDGLVILSRCTVLGRLLAHRLQASECILHELAEVDDIQDGCVRFSTWAQGSVLPRQYESVSIRQLAAIFTSGSFGNPAYAQLLASADRQIIPVKNPTVPQNTISAGAEDGAEMGAYARDKNPIRAQALLLKLREFMPANLTPIIVDVT